MKKILYLLIAVVFFASACEEEDNLLRYDLGTEFLVSVGDMTSLDDNVTVSITNNEKNLSEVSVSITEGAALGTVALSDGSGSIVLSGTDLGVSAIEDAASLQFDAVFDGKPIVRYGSLELTDPISVTDPGVLHKDTTYHFIFEVAPVSATVTSVTVRTKVSEAGTYVSETGPFDVAIDSIPLLGTDYAIGDTIFVEVTANTATKTAVTVTELVVEPDSYQSMGSFTLDNSYNVFFSPDDTLAYDMILDRTVLIADVADSADVRMYFSFAGPDGSLDIQLISDENMVFVQVPDIDAAEVYANADILTIEGTNFTLAPNAVNVKAGEVYMYRTFRGTGAPYSYGILKVVSTDVPAGGAIIDATMEIEYKYTEQ